MQKRSNDHPLPLGRQLWKARRCAGLTAKELALKAGLSPAAVYNVESPGRGGRTRTLFRLVFALDLTLRIPDLAALAKERGLSESKLALVAEIAFDTVRAVLANPLCCNVRSFEKVCAALDHPINLVV